MHANIFLYYICVFEQNAALTLHTANDEPAY